MWYQYSAISVELERLSEDTAFLEARNSLRPGKFDRNPDDPMYNRRLVYTRELRRFMYNPSLLEAIFSSPDLKELFFRTFGYRGQLAFTIYPNCWLRDLPLLDIGENAYLGDGIVLGTNQVSLDQRSVTVDEISIGAGTVINQQCMIGYGTRVGADCAIGARVLIGMRTMIGSSCCLKPTAKVGYHCRIGKSVSLGIDSTLGSFSIVDEGVHIKDYVKVPEYSHVKASGTVPRRRNGEVVISAVLSRFQRERAGRSA